MLFPPPHLPPNPHSIVLENSGVAEPQNIRDKFAEAVAAGHPLARRVTLDAMVTIVDAGAFVGDFASRAPLAARPDLGEGGNLRPVVDLLVEQVREIKGVVENTQTHAHTASPTPPHPHHQIECADFVILNKIDQLAEGGLDSLRAIVASLNPLARTVACERGRVDVEDVFGPASSGLVAHLTVEGQHRGAVAAAAAAEAAAKEEEGEEGEGDGHGHHHHHHYHDHGHACSTDCKEEHDHEHDHHHDHDGPCGVACGVKPKRARQDTTAASRFGIRSFVYRRRRPFHPGRLRDTVLRWLPVATNAALADSEGGDGGDPAASAAAAVVNRAAAAPPPANASPIRTVLRSKGFMWMSHSHETAFYWSHAGQHFEIRDEGDWWAAVPRDSWPEDEAAVGVITADFDGAHGDRRQEIVFIGAGMDDAAIVAALDGALLTDEDMGTYEATFAGGGGGEGVEGE